MSVLSKQEIISNLNGGLLIRNNLPNRFSNAQPASYDLSVGVIVKKNESKFPWGDGIQQVNFDPNKSLEEQETVTLKPGQILFIVTREDVIMPKELCGTVYSKNHLSLEGVLAWTTGHVDPGYEGPIIIRLINMRSTDYSIKPGAKIYTIVFEDLKYSDKSGLEGKKGLSREEAVQKVTKSANAALGNTLHDLALLTNFVKKEEFGKMIIKWLFGTFWRVVRTVLAFVLFVLTTAVSIAKAMEVLKNWGVIEGN